MILCSSELKFNSLMTEMKSFTLFDFFYAQSEWKVSMKFHIKWTEKMFFNVCPVINHVHIYLVRIFKNISYISYFSWYLFALVFAAPIRWLIMIEVPAAEPPCCWGPSGGTSCSDRLDGPAGPERNQNLQVPLRPRCSLARFCRHLYLTFTYIL